MLRPVRPVALVVWPNDGEFGVEGAKDRYRLPQYAAFQDIPSLDEWEKRLISQGGGEKKSGLKGLFRKT